MNKMQHFGFEDDIIIHIEVLEEFFCSNDIKDEDKRRSNLLTSLSLDVYKLLRNHVSPKVPKEINYAELTVILKKQFARQSVRFKERKKFYDASQLVNEGVKEYFNRIKALAVSCEFGAQLENILKDKFICGLRKGDIFDKLCDIGIDSEITVCVEEAMKREALIVDAVCNKIIGNSTNKRDADKKRMYPTANVQSQKNNSTNLCYACGKSNHKFKTCKYRKYKCRNCGKIGHLQVMCKSVKFMTQDECSSGTEEKEDPEYQIFSLRNDMYCSNRISSDSSVCNNNFFNNYRSDFDDNFAVILSVNNIDIKFEIDTGSAVTTIPEVMYKKYFRMCKVKNFKGKLRAYDGSTIAVEGYFDANVKYKRKIVSIPLLIIRTECKPLLGRNVLNKLGCNIEFNVNNILNESQYDISNILSEFSALFSPKLGKYIFEKVRLEVVENTVPVFVCPRKVPFAYREALGKELARLESLNVITKSGVSAWGTPLVIVVKKCGNLRICGDYSKTINPHLKESNYPLPLIDDIFQTLQRGKYYSKIDLSEAYHQIEVDDETSSLLAWSTHLGTYKVNRLPFGCKPNSSIFQSVMEKVLLGCSNTVVYIDDIVVSGRTIEEHNQNLKMVLRKLEEAGFVVNKSKCLFLQQSVKYLGFIIDQKGLHKDPSKIKAVCEMTEPKNKTEAKSFCGFVNYYAKFIPNLAYVLKPLYESFSGNSFEWTDKCTESMNLVKKLITSDIVLAHYDPKKQLILSTDASESGLGACLAQGNLNGSDEQPIAYASRTLSKAEKNYSVIDKEACAIYFGVRKFEQYLMGRKFQIKTDHKPLIAIFGLKKGIPAMAANRLARWSIYLSAFDFEICYIQGSTNNCADALSRLTNLSDVIMNEEIFVLKFIDNNFSRPIRFDDVAKQTICDPILSKIVQFVKSGWPVSVKNLDQCLKIFYDKRNEINLDNNILLWGHRVIIPSKFRKTLLDEIHSTHIGIVRTKALVRSYFWWPAIDKDIEMMINSCYQCKHHQNNPPKSKPIPWPDTTFAMERIHIDFCGPKFNYFFLIMVDAHTKWIEVIKLKSITSKCTIECLEAIFVTFGFPKNLISDNGPSLVSAEFELFCRKNGINHTTSPPYHPASNGQAENAVKIFKHSLEKLMSDSNDKDNLDKKIKKLMFMHRNTISTVTQKTPYEMMFGRKPFLRWELLKPTIKNRSVTENPFMIGQYVYAKNFTSSKYELGRVISLQGNKSCEIQLEDGRMYRRHVDHITPALPVSKNHSVPNKFNKDIHTQNNLNDILKQKLHIPQKFYETAAVVPNCKPGNGVENSIIANGRDCEVRLVPIQLENMFTTESAARSSSSRPTRQIKVPDRLNL